MAFDRMKDGRAIVVSEEDCTLLYEVRVFICRIFTKNAVHVGMALCASDAEEQAYQYALASGVTKRDANKARELLRSGEHGVMYCAPPGVTYIAVGPFAAQWRGHAKGSIETKLAFVGGAWVAPGGVS